MLRAIVDFSLRFRGVVVALACVVLGYGIYVARHAELAEAEVLHEQHLVIGHGSFRIRGVVGVGRWLCAVAVAAQVRGNEGEVARQQWRHPMPHHVRFRKAVQQQQRMARSFAACEDRRLANIDDGRRESFEGVSDHGAGSRWRAAPRRRGSAVR